MRYLVFSDIHGNLPAFEQMLKNEQGVDGYINIGDVVNYGPWSNECVQLVDNLQNIHNIVGNHEEYFISGICNVKSELVQKFFEFTYEKFTEQEKISQYKDSIIFNDFKLIHTLKGKEYVFKDSEVEWNENIILGHSHQQYLRYKNNKLLLNPGSVGQNRKVINVSNYAIWDIETGEFQLKAIKYDFKYFITEMEKQKYPKECIEYYKSKTIN